jgi:hypothetical protein
MEGDGGWRLTHVFFGAKGGGCGFAIFCRAALKDKDYTRYKALTGIHTTTPRTPS